MKIIDDDALARFRGPRTCENCMKPCRKPEPHHLHARGMGGGGRIDLPINLISLCRQCHQELHDSNLGPEVLADVVARRERTTTSAIEDVVYLVRRLDKHATQETIWGEIECLEDPESRRLAKDQLEKAGVL